MLEYENENVDGQIDGQKDIRHINVIGGLVTRNLPKKCVSTVNSFWVIINHTTKKLNKNYGSYDIVHCD